ncbi:salicylate hydroxylase [Stutzerimonas stutzeri]|uniref:Salicylate hydroxylase n=1 Tax=Stutzerimonas stutzeri TaxID=316 RepID=A0A2S4AML7_STUST|nr:salicylate hydroxylase [Stutzerimonas stutzeri]
MGGGIAGLAMARALELKGFTSDLIERRADLPQGGTGLYLPGNATRALQALGLLDSITAGAVPITTQRILDSRGTPLSVTRTGDVWSSCGPCLALPRAALHVALRNSLRDTELRFGTSLTGIEQRGPISLATFSDGTAGEYDLVIGADGIHSQVRQELFPDVKPSYTGNVCWRFITKDIAEVDGWTVMLGDGMSLLAIPISADQVYVYADMAINEWETQRNLTDLPPGLIAAFSPPLSPLITHMPADAQIHFSHIEQVVMNNWVKGRAVLIGDAAHASSPSMAEGAAMAMEDALVLAETLGRAPKISDALAEYTRRRKPHVDWVHKQCAARDRMRGLPGWARVPLLKFAGNALYKRSYLPLTEPT